MSRSELSPENLLQMSHCKSSIKYWISTKVKNYNTKGKQKIQFSILGLSVEFFTFHALIFWWLRQCFLLLRSSSSLHSKESVDVPIGCRFQLWQIFWLSSTSSIRWRSDPCAPQNILAVYLRCNDANFRIMYASMSNVVSLQLSILQSNNFLTALFLINILSIILINL